MKLNLYNQIGKKISKQVELDDSVFQSRINNDLMNLAVQVYLGNRRQTPAHAKTRAEVRGGGAKPWRQKGTGRARHGSIRSPIWKGGGVAFGPRKDRNYKKRMSRSMRKAAIRSAFSLFAKESRLIVVDNVDISDKAMTKQVVEMTSALTKEDRVLYIHNGKEKKLYLGSRNLKKINAIPVNETNVYTLVKHKQLIILEDTLDEISKMWGRQVTKKGSKSQPKKEDKNTTEPEKKIKKKEDKKQENDIETLGLSSRIETALDKAGIKSKNELASRVNSKEKIEGIGPKSIEEIKKALN